MNYKLTLQYDGTDFHGWQIQESTEQDWVRTVQGELTRVLSLLEGRTVQLSGAGRTDAGVHAEAQIANVHLERAWGEEKLRAAINGNLASDLRVINVQIVPRDFHARFSAIGKTYRYTIFNAPFVSPFLARFALHESRPLNLERMQMAARIFPGTHDWTAFSAAQSEARSRVRTIENLEVGASFSERFHGRLVEIRVTADGFLRYMVRAIAGTLLAVGRTEIDCEQVERAIQTGDRALCGATLPPHGLTLVKVHY
ncbi:MAG: tRNA pseudouridine(38-40) synthase TruA [Pyrinomonadaceae bacterium]